MPGAGNAKKPSYRFRRNAFSVRRFSDSFHRRSDFWHQHGDEFLKKYLSPFLNGSREPDSVLISDEAVTRLNHFNIRQMPGAFERYEIENNFRLFAQAAKRIGFAHTKVLLVIRRQDDLLASSYAQLSRKIVGASQADFEGRIRKLTDPDLNADGESFYSLDYYEVYQSLTRILSKENVMVLPLEAMSDEFATSIERLAQFFATEETRHSFSKVPANSRSAGDNKWGLRPLLLFKSARPKIEITLPRSWSGRSEHVELTKEMSSVIMSYYAKNNRRLNELLDIDLCKYGYCSR